jgi:hypothetical protein
LTQVLVGAEEKLGSTVVKFDFCDFLRPDISQGGIIVGVENRVTGEPDPPCVTVDTGKYTAHALFAVP